MEEGVVVSRSLGGGRGGRGGAGDRSGGNISISLSHGVVIVDIIY